MAGSVLAEDYESLVQRAFESIEDTSAGNWAYTESSTTKGVTRVRHFDPRRPDGERWTLISIDGNPPTAQEREEYEQDADESEGMGFGSEFITTGSLQLIEETEASYRFGFSPNVKDESEDAEIMRHVNGELGINKRAQYVETIHLRNTEPFKPKTGVRISIFDLTMKFGPTADGGPIVLLSVNVRVQGRAYLMFKFDEVEEAVYSDYVEVAE